MLNGEWAQPASNTYYLTLGPEEPAVTNQLRYTLLEVTVTAVEPTPTHVHPLRSASETLIDLSFGSRALESHRGCLETQKTIPDMHRNQIPPLV